jgi:hypothetical protein
MRTLTPAAIHTEPPAPTTEGVHFLEASGRRLCLWPMSGAGADLWCCGRRRGGYAYPYCREHYVDATTPAARARLEAV